MNGRYTTLGRAAIILEAFDGAGDGWLPLKDIVRSTQMNRSTVYRVLQQMVTVGWLQQVGTLYARTAAAPARGRSGSGQDAVQDRGRDGDDRDLVDPAGLQ